MTTLTQEAEAIAAEVGADVVNQFETMLTGMGIFLVLIVAAVILKPVFLTISERADSYFKS